MYQASKLFEQLNSVATMIATAIYWQDKCGRILGANDHALQLLGASSSIIGKTLDEIYPHEIAQPIVCHNQEVISTGQALYQEETVKNLTTGARQSLMSIKVPIHDEQSNIVGIVITAQDIIATRQRSKDSTLNSLKKIAQILPINVYWMDTRNILLGVNNPTLEAVGALCYDDIIGKTLYDFYPDEIAEPIVENHNEVLATGKTLTHEEMIEDIHTGAVKYFTAIKSPLYDESGTLLGTVGVSIDITSQKQAEKLAIENTAHKHALKEQEKFIKIANQVAHDIRSPSAALAMLATACVTLPEKDRTILRTAVGRIEDIAHYLLAQYKKPNDKSPESKKDAIQPLLVSTHLLEILTEKKYHHQHLAITFDTKINQSGSFAFIYIKPSAFDRMLSNLLNNAIQAVDPKTGAIELELTASEAQIELSIQDNGKGIPSSILEKINNNLAITAGKKEGHGIGLTQVRDTLARYNGRFTIDSIAGKGTRITLTFPQVAAPNWITASQITLNAQDQVLILDDDPAIHGAWDARLLPLKKEFPDLSIKHFTEGSEVLNYLDTLSETQKKRLFLLSDYELIGQSNNGLQIIEESNLARTLLVTSHYANPELQAQAIKIGTSILPKALASEIALVFASSLSQEIPSDLDKQSVSVVVVDDDTYFAKTLMDFLFSNQSQCADHYAEPQDLLDAISKYSKQTIFLLDNHFTRSTLSGIDLAQQLYQQGYKQLYLLSGEQLDPDQLPNYLTLTIKSAQGMSYLKEIVMQQQNLLSDDQSSDDVGVDLTKNKISSVRSELNNPVINQQFLQGIQGFVNRIAHDLATPLMIIGMNNTTLQEALPTLLDSDSQQPTQNLDAEIVGIQESTSRVAALIDELSSTFRNLIQKNLNPSDFMKCSIYNSINYALATLASEQYKRVSWEREELFDFLGNEIASIQLIRQLLVYIFNSSKDHAAQDIVIMQESHQSHNTVYIKQVVDASVDNKTLIPASQLGMEVIFAMQILEKFGGELTCYTLPNQYLQFVLSFPSYSDA